MESNSAESVSWSDTYRYATELIDEGILSKDEILDQLSIYKMHSADSAYSWLAEEASCRHIDNLNKEDDVAVDLSFKERTRKVERNKKRDKAIGRAFLALSSFATVNYFTNRENLNTTDMVVIILEAAIIVSGIKYLRNLEN